MFKRQRLWAVIAILIFAVSLGTAQLTSVMALISDCTANVDPTTTTRSATQRFTFTVTSADPLERIEIDAPSGEYAIVNAGGDGWNVNSQTSDHVIFVRGGSGDEVFIDATTGSNDTDEELWGVQASDDPGGADMVGCSGTLGTSISGQGADTSAPVLSNLTLSNLTPTSVSISWQTDEPSTSRIDYGLSDDYGLFKTSGSTLSTNHTITLTGLTPNTGYHYAISNTDASNNTGSTNDNTFLTPLNQSSSAPQPISVPIKAVPTETVPPTVLLSTNLATPFKQIPAINGAADDNEALAGIEYSTDGGKNWLPADSITGLNTKHATFTFTPLNLDDGNYELMARAVDTSGNIGVTQTATLIIDQLPPQVGGNVIALGPQILEPDSNGVARALAGVDQKITLSAVGGPTSIVLTANAKEGKNKPKMFVLTKSVDTGLWSGVLAFTEPGLYSLTARSIDGAHNETSRLISTVQVETPARVAEGKGTAGVTATVTAYYFEPESQDWVIWDAQAYGQINPQTTDKNGNFTLFVPPGTYYLTITARGHRKIFTTIFKVTKPMPISTTLHMHKSLPLLSIGNDLASIDPHTSTTKPVTAQTLTGQTLPSLDLTGPGGNAINTISWLGKPTVITLTSIWSPTTAEQVPALTAVQKHTDVNVIPVAVQERIAKTKVYGELSGHDLQWLADPTGSLSTALKIQGIPVHYFVDRKGVIKKVDTGVLTEKQLLETLAGL